MVNNRNYSRQTAQKLRVQRKILYTPEAKSDWGYAHHTQMMVFRGKLYIMWSLGRTHEDLFGQKIMYAYTENGTDWSEPAPLVDTMMGVHSEAALMPGCFHQHDGVLYAFVNYMEYEIESVLPRGYIAAMRHAFKDWFPLLSEKTISDKKVLVTCTEDGIHWSAPAPVELECAGHPPFRTSTGRLILSGSIAFPYTDDPTGLTGWEKVGLFPKEEADAFVDAGDGRTEMLQKQGYETALGEPCGYQTDDGVIHMLLRYDEWVDDKCYLFESRSYDNGETWSAPESTEFTNDHTMFYCSRLPDGRFYLVGSPELHGGRCPLVVSLSDNGEDFDRHYIIEDETGRIPLKFLGMNKHKPVGFCFSYPSVAVFGGRMYVATGANKETILVSSFDLDQLK